MKRVYQKGDDDCLSAAIASILEIPLHTVPVFRGTAAHQLAKAQRWLKRLGYGMVEVAWKDPQHSLYNYGSVAVYGIGTIDSGRSPCAHAVVVVLSKGRVRVVHDPDRNKTYNKRCNKNRLVAVGLIVSGECVAA